jgi:hypothetical protein
MHFAGNLHRFPTHTHDFGNHNNGYDYSKTTFMQSLVDSRESHSSTGLNFDMVPNSDEIYEF